jgi:hypothetical protein
MRPAEKSESKAFDIWGASQNVRLWTGFNFRNSLFLLPAFNLKLEPCHKNEGRRALFGFCWP